MADVCVIYGTVLGLDGTPASGVEIRLRTSHTQRDDSNNFIMNTPLSAETDASGNFSFSAVYGTEVTVFSENVIRSLTFSVPSAASSTLAELIPE